MNLYLSAQFAYCKLYIHVYCILVCNTLYICKKICITAIYLGCAAQLSWNVHFYSFILAFILSWLNLSYNFAIPYKIYTVGISRDPGSLNRLASPLVSGVVDPHRLDSDPDPDPTLSLKWEKIKKFHVLKCWMFSFKSWRLLL